MFCAPGTMRGPIEHPRSGNKINAEFPPASALWQGTALGCGDFVAPVPKGVLLVAMDATQETVLNIFKRTGALLEGHFLLRSGLHSRHFFQCARVCENMDAVSELATLMLARISDTTFSTVLAPAMGGLVIGQEVARQAHVRFIFAEKEDGRLTLRRGFRIDPGEKILIVEDVITRGGRVREALDIVREKGGQTVGIAVLVDRSEGQARFNIPLHPLLEMSFPTYAADALPGDLAAIPALKPGS